MSDAASGSGSGGAQLPEPRDHDDILRIFNQMREQVNALWRKINELDIERQEHGLVLGALQPMDDGRKCFRLIGDVLVERTVGEVRPAVSRNQEGIATLVGKLQEQLNTQKQVMSEFQAKYKIQVKGQGDEGEAADAKAAGTQGVLVGES